MSIPLWGQLQKAQDDPETIEQAIARLIGEHEADPESHLGEGESLSMHKHEDVIDHPASSVLADKFSRSELLIDGPFWSLDSFNIGGWTALSGLRLLIPSDWETPAVSYAALFIPKIGFSNILSGDFSLRNYAGYSAYGSGHFVQFGIYQALDFDNSTLLRNGFYFSVEDQVLKARVRYSTYDEVVVIGNLGDIVLDRNFEITFSFSDKILRFFMDEVQVASFDLSSAPGTFNAAYLGWRAYAPDETNQCDFASARLLWAISPPL